MVDHAWVELLHAVPIAATENERRALVRRHEDFYRPFGFADFYRPFGFAMPDDFEVAFRRISKGIHADRANRRIWFNRGAARERIEADDRG